MKLSDKVLLNLLVETIDEREALLRARYPATYEDMSRHDKMKEYARMEATLESIRRVYCEKIVNEIRRLRVGKSKAQESIDNATRDLAGSMNAAAIVAVMQEDDDAS